MGARQVWLALSALAYACDAASSGAKICDALNVCNFRKFNFSCPTGMQLVAPPTRVDNYTLRTADTPYAERAHDPTTYTPGVFNELHLRVLHPQWKYIGLLLYAVQTGEGHVDEDENLIETPIGEWDVSAAPDEFYISPACGAAAVTHMDANAKRMHHRFHWRAPTGLGRVTFRLLLKWGETNGGNFYWPMTAGDLTLDEGAIVPDANASASWVAAPANVTCDEACAARAGACDGAALAAAAAASTDAFVEHMAPSRVCRLPVLEGCGFATDEDAHCYHYDGAAREGCANANATDDAALARPLACDEAPAAPYSPDATDAGDDGMERLCACSFGPTASPTPLPTVSPLPTPRPSPVPTSVPTSVPTYRPTNYRTQKLGPFAPARDTTVRLGNTQVINPASGALQCRRGTNNEYVAVLQWDIAPIAAELAASAFTAHGVAYATVALRVTPRVVNNTLSVHALAANFPKCCWEANGGSWNISGEVFDELGGVDPYSDPPIATWTLSPQERQNWYYWMEFNMTLDDATVAALVSPDTASGRFGVVLSSASEDGVMYIQSTESSNAPELSLQFEIEASSLARNWDPPTPAPTVSAAPTTQVVFTYQSRYSVYVPANLADALSKWAELEAEAPTEGYCDMDLTSSWNLKNGYVCPNGRGNDFAFEVEVTFTIGSGRAGHWKFETRVDASRGGLFCMDDDCTFVAHDSKDFRPMELDFYGDRYYYNLYHWEGVLAEGRHTFKTIAWEKCCSSHGWMLVEMPGGILPGVCAIRPDTLDSESCAYYDETWGWCTGYTLTDDSPYWHQPGAFLPGQVHASMCDTTCGLYSTCTTATCTADEYYECNPDLGNFHESNAMDMRKEREFGNVTAERLASLIYSPSPTTPAPSAAFTPSPLPTPEPTNGDLWTWQSRFTWDHVLNEEGGVEAARLLYQHLAQVQPDTDGGFCDRQISSMWNMQNFYLCYCANYNNLNWREDATRVGCDEGDPAFSSVAKSATKSLNRLIYPGGATTNVAFRAFAGFTVPANMSGTWRFQISYDHSRGGFWCFDADCTFAAGRGEEFWEGDLAEGYHSFEWIGIDKCCHNLGAVMAQPPGWDYYGNFSLAMLGAASPSPTVSPTFSVVPTVSVPPTRADDCYAQPDNFAYCDVYWDECHTLMNPLEGACDYDGAPANCGHWAGRCDTTCGFESTCNDRSLDGTCLIYAPDYTCGGLLAGAADDDELDGGVDAFHSGATLDDDEFLDDDVVLTLSPSATDDDKKTDDATSASAPPTAAPGDPTALPLPAPTTGPTAGPSTFAPTPAPIAAFTTADAVAVGPYYVDRDTTVFNGRSSSVVFNPASVWLNTRGASTINRFSLLQWDVAPIAEAIAQLPDMTAVQVSPIATLTVYFKPGSRSSGMTVRVHALESDFPSCCWEVNDLRKNITYDVFEAHGGVDVDADAPLDSWLATAERISESNWWYLDFNVTLDEMTRAALASGGGGHIGFVISTDMAQTSFIVSKDHAWTDHHPRLTVYAGAASTTSPAPTAPTQTAAPIAEPTVAPHPVPTVIPGDPTAAPVTALPVAAPTAAPRPAPTAKPTAVPHPVPTVIPGDPTAAPTTRLPSEAPIPAPTAKPTAVPHPVPTVFPGDPTAAPVTALPVAAPTAAPFPAPTAKPTSAPTVGPGEPTPRPTVGLGVCSAAPSYTEELCAAINGECYPSRAACTADGGCDFYAEGCGDGECGCCIPALLCGGSPPAPTLETPIAETSALETAPEVPVPEGDGVQRSGATTPPVALMGLVLAGSAVAACVVCALRWRAKTRSLSKTTMRQPGWVEDTDATVRSTGANPMQMTEQREIEMAENPGSTVQSTSANPMQMTEQHEVM